MRLLRGINGLHLGNLRGDIYGGLTAAVVALPLALAMGVASGAGPVAGVYGAICVGFFAALFGGTPAQISGPTGPMTVVMAAIFTQYTSLYPDDPAQGAAIAFTVVMMGGLLQIVFGLARFGKFIELVPVPVVSGFMSGIGVIIILLQLPPLLGHVAQTGPLASAAAIPAAWQALNPSALMLGGVALAVVYLMPRAWRRVIPSPLLAMLVGTALAIALVAPGSVPVLGEVPGGLPELRLPTLTPALLIDMLVSAVTLAALGSIDSLLTSLVADNVTRTHHRSDHELVGQGIGNFAAGLLGGLPGAGATMRTMVNVHAGGRTPLSGMLHALVLLAFVLGAGWVVSEVPHTVLAAILIKVGTDIIDWDFLRRLRGTPATEVFNMLVVLLLTVFVDLIKAVAVGMAIAGLIFMKRTSDHQLASINVYRPADQGVPLSDEERAILNGSDGDILMIHFGSPMSFGAARGMTRRLERAGDSRVLVLDLSDMVEIDFSATRSLCDVVRHASELGRRVILAGGRPQVLRMLKSQDLGSQARPGCGELLQPNRLEALRSAARIVAEQRQAEQGTAV
jgi:SulP family sulfate permease